MVLAQPGRAEPETWERLYEWRNPAGRPTIAIDRDEHGYRFDVQGTGVYLLSADGTRLTCHPSSGAGLHWRSYLIGQVLPFAALLQGLEVFHASAVELDGAAAALAGPSGVGKSTLALNLHLGGAGFITDDVLAVELDGGELVAHPGLGAAKLRRAALDLVDGTRLRAPVASDAQELRYELEPVPRALPLRTFCVVERSGDGTLRVDEGPCDPWRLLASTFNLVVETPERLAAQLDLCAAIASCVRVLRIAVPDSPGPAVAAQLRARLSALPDAA